MKILHIASGDRWAGAEVQVFTLLRELQKDASLTVYAVILNEGELAQRLQAKGIAVTVLDESRLGGVTILRELIRLIKAIRPEIIHSHRQKENVLVSVANFLSDRAKCLRTVHGAPEHSTGPFQLSRFLNCQADLFCGRFLQQRVVAVSSDLGEKLRNDYSASKIVVVNNGIACDGAKDGVAVADYRIEAPAALHIGFAGRLEPVKRVDLFIAMADFLLENSAHIQWRFHIYGDGALREQLQAQHQQTRLGNKLQFHGHRSDIDVCLASLDALVICSDHEGTPMTVLEAIMLGTPVVAHHAGGLVELLRDGNGGFLVNQHDAQGYAAAVTEIVENPERAAQCVEAGQENVRRNYSASANASQLIAVYRALLNGAS